MSDTLLPCPFCGGEARIEQHEKSKWLAFCDDVYGCGTEGWYEDTPEEAIAAWNRRSPTIPPDVREAIRKLADYGMPLGATNHDWKRWRDIALTWLDAQEDNHE